MEIKNESNLVESCERLLNACVLLVIILEVVWSFWSEIGEGVEICPVRRVVIFNRHSYLGRAIHRDKLNEKDRESRAVLIGSHH